MDDVQYRQQRLSNRFIFEFGKNQLRYRLRDSSGKRNFSVNYFDIEPEAHELEERNLWFRNAGVLWCLLGLVHIGLIQMQEQRWIFSIWLLIGALCLAMYAVFKTKFSYFRTPHGNIFVIHNKIHDRIVQEIELRRKSQLLATFGTIDYSNDLEDEINKFKWLHSQGAINKEQLKQTLRQIGLLQTSRIVEKSTDGARQYDIN